MKNVMIVDDNCLTAEGIEKNIDWSALDATVIAVEYNSLSALDILKDTHVDLIISDIMMPNMDGSRWDLHESESSGDPAFHKSYSCKCL